MYILGISAFYHDSAACLLKDGKIIAAAHEERFSRKKHDSSFPSLSIEYCIREANISSESITAVVFYEKPFVKFERLLETYLAFAPKGFSSFRYAMPLWVNNKLFQKNLINDELKVIMSNKVNWEERLFFSEHHLSHAASAFYPSPYKRAAILTFDGVGEWTTTSVAIGNNNKLKILKEIRFPHSIGLLYSAFTYYTGFKVNSGEYKVMGLAPYGKPLYKDIIKEKLINIAEDGSFQLDMSYFSFATGLKMTNNKFNSLFGGPPRSPESQLTQKDMDLAASIQKVTEELILSIAKNVQEVTGEQNLCLAGGVALNCVANGLLKRKKIFKNIWIQPAAGDAGGAIGAALSYWHLQCNKSRDCNGKKDSMNGAYLGPSYGDKDIISDLKSFGANFEKLDKNDLIEKVVADLIDQKAVGWMQGRMEFGPRALGNRSILADPRSPKMQKQLNLKVKYRESFRPFAPSVLIEDVKNWFEHDYESPYMLFVSNILEKKRIKLDLNEDSLFGIKKLYSPRSQVPAITHVDYSARIQTVHHETNPLYHELISNFKEKTGFPMLVNTSFNIRGEPIVCNPQDAFKCFMGTELDILVIGNFYLKKTEQDKSLKESYRERYELD